MSILKVVLLCVLLLAKLYQIRQAISEATHEMFYENEHNITYGFDQKMLNTYSYTYLATGY